MSVETSAYLQIDTGDKLRKRFFLTDFPVTIRQLRAWLAAFILALTTIASAQTVLTSATPVTYSDSPHLFSFNQSVAYWSVVGVRPSGTSDYDISVYNNLALTTLMGRSALGVGSVDFVMCNYNHTQTGTYYPQVVNYSGTGPYTTEWEDGTDAIPNNSTTASITWGATNVVKAFDISLAPGTHTITLNRTSGTANLQMAIYSAGTPYFYGRSSYSAIATGNGTTMTLNITAPSQDWYGVAVWCDVAGSATFTISHAVATPSITVTAPSTNTTWDIGSSNYIFWSSVAVSGNVMIERASSSNGPWTTLVSSTTNNGFYYWQATPPTTPTFYVRVTSLTDTTVRGISTPGVLNAPSYTITSPIASSNWVIGTQHNITWTHDINDNGSVFIDVDSTGTGNWHSLVRSIPDTGTYPWTVTGPARTNAQIRIGNAIYTGYNSTSSLFTVSNPLPLPGAPSQPNPADTSNGVVVNPSISWVNGSNTASIALYFGTSYNQVAGHDTTIRVLNNSALTNYTPPTLLNSTIYYWTVVETNVTGSTSGPIWWFTTIAPSSITVTDPAPRVTIPNPSVHNILWSSFNVTGNVKIELNRNYPDGIWETLTANTTNTGSWQWPVSGNGSSSARIRITTLSMTPQVTGLSASFNIAYTYPITGQITINGNGLRGVWLSGFPDSVVTDSSGNYYELVPQNWGGTVVPLLAGYSFSPVSRSYSEVFSARTGQDYTASIVYYSISGHVTLGGSILPGVTLSGLPNNPVTNSDGNYSDLVPYGWNGTVTPTFAGYSFNPVHRTYSNVVTNQSNQSYTADSLFYRISGRITNGGNGLSGVTLSGLPHSPVTNANGDYSDSVYYGWGGTVIPNIPGFHFTPFNRTYSNIASTQLAQNYTANVVYLIISGRVYNGDFNFPGVVMTGLPHSPTTNANGDYSDSVAYGFSGTVVPTYAGYSFTPVNHVYSGIIRDQLNQNFNGSLNYYQISGRVSLGGSILPGVTLNGLPGAPVTNSDGNYSDMVPYGWSGTVTPTLAGFTFNPASRIYNNVSSDLSNQSYVADTTYYQFTGRVTSGGNGLQGVTISGLPHVTTTNASGNYSDTVRYGWSGTVTPSKAGYTFSPVNHVYTNVTSAQSNQNFTANLIYYTISGRITSGGNGLSGVTLTGLPHTPTTNANGDYTDSVAYGFSGTVTPSNAGYTFSPFNHVYTNVTSAQTNQNFSANLIYYTISGRVTFGGNGLSGVTLSGLPHTPTTNANGDYSDSVAYGFSGTVTPTLAGYTFSPTNHVYTNVTSAQTIQNFSANLIYYTISGRVTVGTNGLLGVSLSGLPHTPTTNANGDYTDSVAYGYSGTVTPSLAGYTFTPIYHVYSNVTSIQSNQNFSANLNYYTISGRVTAGGNGLSGVTLNGLPHTPVTNASGDYSDSVAYGFNGTVTPSLAGYTFTLTNHVYTNVTSAQSNQNFSAILNYYTISGRVTAGGNGQSGVTLSGLPHTLTTNANGDYSDSVAYGFSGTVTPTLAGYTFSPANHVYTNVTSAQTNQNFIANLIYYTINGRVTVGGNGLSGVTLTGLPHTPTTNANGDYSDSVAYGFTGAVTPILAGYTFTPTNHVYSNISSAQSNQNFTANLIYYSISGRVTAGGNGLSGVILSGLPHTPVTNASGDYSDSVAYGFSGTVTPSFAGYTFAPTNHVYSNITSAQTNQNFTANLIYYTISGRVTAGGNGLQGVTLSGLPHTPTTNANGDYSDSVAYGFSGTVTPTLAGYTFSPTNHVYTNVTSAQTNQNFTANLIYYSISGRVTFGGNGLSGVTLSGLPHTPTTNANGDYSDSVAYGFNGTVTPSLAGHTFTPTNHVYTNVTSAQTNQNFTANFIYYTISGRVTSGGNGLSGVTMSGLPHTPITNANGDYSDTVAYGFTGTVTPSFAGYTFAPTNHVYSNITSAQTNQNFTANLIYYTISGRVTASGNGLQGVTLSGLPHTPTTNANGDYSDSVAYGFTGTVTPSLAGCNFTPTNHVYTNVTSAQSNQNYTANIIYYTISGRVTAGGNGLSGMTLTGLPHTPITNANGDYSDSVAFGFSGTVTPSLAGYTFSPANHIYTNITSAQTNQNFTANLIYYTISGQVTAGGIGLSGVTLSGLPHTPTTNANGDYSDSVAYGFSGTVTPSLAGYTFNPVNRIYTNVTSTQANQNFTANLVYYTISGHITAGGNGLSGVILSGLPHTTVTNADGDYSDSVAYGFNGTVVPTLAGYTFSPVNLVYSNVTGSQTNQNYTANIIYYTISGRVTAGGNGLSGMTLTGLPHTPITNANGDYSDSVAFGFSGTVTPSLAGYTFSPANHIYTNITSAQTNQNFTANLIYYTISGRVTVGGNGLSGVTLSGLPHTPITNANGDYSDSVAYGFSGTVTPSLAGYTFNPVNRSYTNLDSAQTNQNFTANLIYYTISGQVTAGGIGLSGVTLSGLPHTPVTNANGDYSDSVSYAWSGIITPMLQGYHFTPANHTYDTVLVNQIDQNYTATINTYQITGRVTIAANIGLDSVLISGLPDSVYTDSTGYYSALVPFHWSGIIRPLRQDYNFFSADSDSVIHFTLVDTSFTGQDFHALFLSVNSLANRLPTTFGLNKYYPNPFNASMTVEISVPKMSQVKLLLYNTLGQRVISLHDGTLSPGRYRYTLQSAHLTSGVYFLQMSATGYSKVVKINVLK